MSERAPTPYRLPQGRETLRWGELYGSGPAYFSLARAVADAPFVAGPAAAAKPNSTLLSCVFRG
jgi:hypothetical protein